MRRCVAASRVEQLPVERLDEARVDDRGLLALRLQQRGRLAGDADAGADADERDVVALLQHDAAPTASGSSSAGGANGAAMPRG